jgi:putative transposase
VVDYVKRWTERTQLPKTRLIGWLGVGTSKFYTWQDRYGQANEHNGQVPRDFWLQDWEQHAILDFHDRHPLDGYRRLAFMMLDDDVVAVSPSTVYRTLKAAGRLDNRRWSPSKKGTGFVQPLAAHDHWHVDISYLNVAGTFYYLTSVLDGFSRYIVHWEIRESMTEADVETIVQRALEKHPGAQPRIISDNGPQSGHPVLRVGPRLQGVHSPGGDHPRANQSLPSPEQRQTRTLARQREKRVHPTHGPRCWRRPAAAGPSTWSTTTTCG